MIVACDINQNVSLNNCNIQQECRCDWRLLSSHIFYTQCVGIAQWVWRIAGRSVDRIPMGKRISAPVQTGPGIQPASYTMGTRSFPVVKRPGRGVDYPPQTRGEVEERVELYIWSQSEPSWPVLV